MKKRVPEKPREFTYTADLAHNPLAEILFTIAQYKVPGVLTFVYRQISKQIYVTDGRIIFASSNAPDDHLGEFLFRCGKISRTDYDRSARLLRESKKKFQGQILVEMKALQKSELNWAVRSHQQAIVWSLFNWFEGQMQFTIGNFKQDETILLDIQIPRVILDGVRHIINAKRIISYIGNRNTILELEENALLTMEIYEGDEKERELLKKIDGKTTLYDLCANSSFGPHEAAKILYGLYTLRLIHKKEEGIRVVSTLPTQNF